MTEARHTDMAERLAGKAALPVLTAARAPGWQCSPRHLRHQAPAVL